MNKELFKKIKLALDCELEDHIRYLLEEVIVYLENGEDKIILIYIRETKLHYGFENEPIPSDYPLYLNMGLNNKPILLLRLNNLDEMRKIAFKIAEANPSLHYTIANSNYVYSQGKEYPQMDSVSEGYLIQEQLIELKGMLFTFKELHEFIEHPFFKSIYERWRGY